MFGAERKGVSEGMSCCNYRYGSRTNFGMEICVKLFLGVRNIAEECRVCVFVNLKYFAASLMYVFFILTEKGRNYIKVVEL